MNREDGLRRYMQTEDIGKAPEGFSSKVMMRIYIEKKPVKEKNSMVLVIYGAVFLALIIVALFVPGNSLNIPEFNFPDNFSFTFPELSSGIIIPRTAIYILAGIVSIALFDSGLRLIFRKDRL